VGTEIRLRLNERMKQAIESAISYYGIEKLSEKCGISPEEIKSALDSLEIPSSLLVAACLLNSRRADAKQLPTYYRDVLECMKGSEVTPSKKQEPKKDKEEAEGVESERLVNEVSGEDVQQESEIQPELPVSFRIASKSIALLVDMITIIAVSWYLFKTFLPSYGVSENLAQLLGIICGVIISNFFIIIKVIRGGGRGRNTHRS